MPGRFVRRRTGVVALRMPALDAFLLRRLLDQLVELIRPEQSVDDDPLAALVGIGTATATPEDPTLARLLPDAYRDDPDAAADFRRYTELGLRQRKLDAAELARDTLVDSTSDRALTPEEAQAWLVALNDLRLALGTRLGVTESWYDDVAQLDESDPRLVQYQVYDWLSYLQETLVRALRRGPLAW